MRRCVLNVFLCIACGGKTWAVIVIDSHGNGNFQGQVLACFERFKSAGGDTADILNQLNQPAPASHRVTIEPTAGGVNTTTPADNGANLQPGGGPGPGSDSTINWNPTNVNPFSDGTPRDPCASLLHEMKHALDMDRGQLNNNLFAPLPQPGSGIQTCEVDACQEENKYRKKAGLPQRRQYGGRDLPPGAIF